MTKTRYYVTSASCFVTRDGKQGTKLYPHSNLKAAVADARSEVLNCTDGGCTSCVCTVDEHGNLFARHGFKRSLQGYATHIMVEGLPSAKSPITLFNPHTLNINH